MIKEELSKIDENVKTSIEYFSNGLAVVEDDKNYYIINQNFYPISTKNKSEFSKIEGNTE